MNALSTLCSIRTHHRNRNILPSELYPAYDSLESAVLSFSKAASLPGDPRFIRDNIQAIWMAVRLDHPEIFWTGNTFSLTASNSTVFEPSYVLSHSEAAVDANLLLAEVRRVEKVLAVTKDPLSIAISVHDYIATTVSYDQYAPHHSDAYGALVSHRGVCQGISAAAALMLNLSGVHCDTYFGKMRSQPDVFHAWNVIPYGQGRLHMDITNDLVSKENQLSRMHALMDEPEAHKILSWMGEVGVSSGYDFYRKCGAYAGSFEELQALISKIAASGSVSGEFKTSGIPVGEIVAAIASAYPGKRIKYKFSPELELFSFEV